MIIYKLVFLLVDYIFYIVVVKVSGEFCFNYIFFFGVLVCIFFVDRYGCSEVLFFIGNDIFEL